MGKEATKGKYGLWYVEGSTAGHATKEQAEAIASEIQDAQRVKSEVQYDGRARKAIPWGIAALAVVGAAFWWQSGADERAANARVKAANDAERSSRMGALLACQKAIRSTARYGDADTPAYVEGERHGETVQFIWQHGSFYFKNGFGASVPQWARCQVDTSTGRITYLVVTGNAVVGGS